MDDLFNGFQIMLFIYLGNREKPCSYFRGILKAESIGGQKKEDKQVRFQIPQIHYNQGSSTFISILYIEFLSNIYYLNKIIHGLGILITTNLVHARIIQFLVKSALKNNIKLQNITDPLSKLQENTFSSGKNYVNMLLIDYFK